MAGACRTADRLVGRLGRDADRGGHLRRNIDLPGGMKDAETGGDCPIDTPVDRSTSCAENMHGFFMVHLTL